MNYYRKNRETLFKKAYDKYHNKGGKQKGANIIKIIKKKSRKKEKISRKICQKMKKT